MSDQTLETTDPADDRSLRSRRDIIGRGVSFPLVIDHNGAVALTSGDDVREAIKMIIMTVPGERVMRPGFGCEIWSHVFSPINASTVGQMAHAVRAALARWEPRIQVEQVRVIPLHGDEAEHGDGVSIDVEYVLRDTNDRRNLVFPFYTIPGERS
ncbi:MAG: GPW/gp25 family protein [Ilumatobacter sp.]